MALNHSASAPGLGRQEGASSSLRSAGAGLTGMASTTTLYEKWQAEGRFRDSHPRIIPAGKSIIVDGDNNGAEPPSTPTELKRFRRSAQLPGERHVHYGLRDQKLPSEDLRFGISTIKGISAEESIKAGQKLGVAEYHDSVAERIYASNKTKALGKGLVRGHVIPVPEVGFGITKEGLMDPKARTDPITKDLSDESLEDRVIFSIRLENLDFEQLKGDPRMCSQIEALVKQLAAAEAGDPRIEPSHVKVELSAGSGSSTVVNVTIIPPNGVKYSPSTLSPTSRIGDLLAEQLMGVARINAYARGPIFSSEASAPKVIPGPTTLFKRTHHTYAPGEAINREYNMPQETKEPHFRFGAGFVNAIEGAGAKMVLSMDLEDDGSVKRTRIVPKVVEDYRNVQHPKLFVKSHQKQGATGPPVLEGHTFGIKCPVGITAESCIKGSYALKEQLPDQDLGRCHKPGRRNVTTETRAFGTPSVRGDIPAPPLGKRSIADNTAYGDECGAAALLNPQRFDGKGVADAEYLIRRPKEELRSLVEGARMADVDFDPLWEEACGLFEDHQPLVSLDAILFLQSKKIDASVSQKLGRSTLRGIVA